MSMNVPVWEWVDSSDGQDKWTQYPENVQTVLEKGFQTDKLSDSAIDIGGDRVVCVPELACAYSTAPLLT